MRNTRTRLGKFVLLLSILAMAAVSALSQVSLRRAMDTDADGKADITVFRPSNSIWYTQKSGGGFSGTTFGLAGEDFMTPGDYDGDGKGDISVWRDANGVFYVLRSSDSTYTAQAWGLTGDEPVARDYDGDAKTDLAVVRRSGGVMTWYVAKSTGGFIGAQWGASTDYASPGDYDGDGKFDLSVQRPGATASSAATFYTLRSSNNVVDVVQWGVGCASNGICDLVVPGDYDGDGKTDYAVVREGATPTTPLIWYVLKSTGGFSITTWGVTGSDLNMQNDYDGDGKTDIAVWRDTTGVYYIQRSTDGGVTAGTWGLSSDYPVASYDTH